MFMPSELGKGGLIMNKEEILEKSRQENHGQDIANLEVSLYAYLQSLLLLKH